MVTLDVGRRAGVGTREMKLRPAPFVAMATVVAMVTDRRGGASNDVLVGGAISDDGRCW